MSHHSFYVPQKLLIWDAVTFDDKGVDRPHAFNYSSKLPLAVLNFHHDTLVSMSRSWGPHLHCVLQMGSNECFVKWYKHFWFSRYNFPNDPWRDLLFQSFLVYVLSNRGYHQLIQPLLDLFPFLPLVRANYAYCGYTWGCSYQYARRYTLIH